MGTECQSKLSEGIFSGMIAWGKKTLISDNVPLKCHFFVVVVV